MILPSVDIHYHFLPPDDVVSARHFWDLAEGLQQRGWEVRVFASNRSCRANGASYPLSETWRGIPFSRTWRPDLNQNRTVGRVINAAWMFGAWALRVAWDSPADVVITGTDPIFSVGSSLPWKWNKSGTKLAHWCFDLYPEALFAEGILDRKKTLGRLANSLSSWFLGNQDLIANLGPCMETLVSRQVPVAEQVTLTPWAIAEPKQPLRIDSRIRQELFGDAQLGLLYSGSFGRAHSFEEILELARRLRGESICFCFAVRGNRVDQLKQSVSPEDTNIRFAGFAAEEDLEARLASADIHVASLRSEWTGCVVPSKFFGSLAIGRPVLFAGDGDSALAKWIAQYNLGWVVRNDNLADISDQLQFFANYKEQLAQMQSHCFATYHARFSKEIVLDKWNECLRALIKSEKKQG